jgi:hypothetical protein
VHCPGYSSGPQRKRNAAVLFNLNAHSSPQIAVHHPTAALMSREQIVSDRCNEYNNRVLTSSSLCVGVIIYKKPILAPQTSLITHRADTQYKTNSNSNNNNIYIYYYVPTLNGARRARYCCFKTITRFRVFEPPPRRSLYIKRKRLRLYVCVFSRCRRQNPQRSFFLVFFSFR